MFTHPGTFVKEFIFLPSPFQVCHYNLSAADGREARLPCVEHAADSLRWLQAARRRNTGRSCQHWTHRGNKTWSALFTFYDVDDRKKRQKWRSKWPWKYKIWHIKAIGTAWAVLLGASCSRDSLGYIRGICWLTGYKDSLSYIGCCLGLTVRRDSRTLYWFGKLLTTCLVFGFSVPSLILCVSVCLMVKLLNLNTV